MAKCEMCGEYRDTTDVYIGTKDSGESKHLNLCTECALKCASIIKTGGGEVRFIDSSKKSGGCMLLLCTTATLGSSMIGCFLVLIA